jgi:hypothetical protein
MSTNPDALAGASGSLNIQKIEPYRYSETPAPSNQTDASARAERLARALVRDWEAQRTQRAPSPSCLMCGRGYAARGTRFCSQRCREVYDNGRPVYTPLDLDKFFTFPRSGSAFRVECGHCRRPFASRGLRCCSPDCERALCQRQARDRELAGNAFRSPRPPCETCGAPLPKWRKGRRLSSVTRFCSARCRKRAQNSRLRHENGKKVPVKWASSVG